ncbi:hypothetical protein [Agrobacterium tumefaciens]|uniref:Uncharacterized protein n=1 Tax=Agrobacterium tumefaciens TaxID=358 RepID=A0A4D7Z1V5_AGRTU|nr:hypothetical protein [Agrobacterium tumefaciens]QCL97952.1 hypothetical protein CFBP7129_27710 [Agrobacterium tumefaciens]
MERVVGSVPQPQPKPPETREDDFRNGKTEFVGHDATKEIPAHDPDAAVSNASAKTGKGNGGTHTTLKMVLQFS